MSLPTPYYADDLVTLYHGDCWDVLPCIEPLASGSALITDPPYGIGWSRATWDDEPERYADLMRRLVAQAGRLVEDGWCFVFQAMPNVARFHEWFPEGWRLFAACKDFVQMRPTEVQNGWDPVVFWRNGEKVSGHRSNIGIVTRDYHVGSVAGMLSGGKPGHPSPRPLDTMRHLVQLATAANGVVVDPFAGSGTTLRAAKDCGRRAIGIEIEERYCEVAANRLRQDVLGLSA